MRNIRIYLLFQIKQILKKWKALLIFWTIPLLLLATSYLLIINLFHPEERLPSIKIAIVDMDQTLETEFVIQQLENNEQLKKNVEIYHTDKANAEKQMKEDAIAAIAIIPEGFSHDVRRGVNTPVTLISNEKRPLQSMLIRNLMDSAARLTSAGQSGINTIWDMLDEEGFSQKELNTEFRKSILSFSLHIIGRDAVFEEHEYSHLFLTNINQYYLLSFYVLIIYIWSFGSIFFIKHEDSEVFQTQLQLRGVTFFQQIAAKQLVLILMLVTPSILLGLIFQKFLSFQDRWELIITGILISTAFSTLFFLVHTVARKLKFYQIDGMLIMLVGVIIGGHLIPTVYFPNWIEKLSAFSVNGIALQHMFSIVSGVEKSGLSLILISGVQFLLAIVCGIAFRRGEL